MNDIFDSLFVGQNYSLSKNITKVDVLRFSEISGDNNPVHLDEDYAANTIFKRPIAHGMISASLFSGIFGAHIPGRGSLYLSQNLKFPNPVYIGDLVTASVTITKIHAAKRFVYFSTTCKDESTNKIVIKGDAVIYVLPNCTSLLR